MQIEYPEDVMKLAREAAEAFTWSSTTEEEAVAIARAIMQDRSARQCEGAVPLVWRDGCPPQPWDKEWFIAQTTYGDRVVLTALPEEFTYDFKTADDTYIKADKIKRWMQFPDSQYIAPSSLPPAGVEKIERLVKALEAAETYVIDGVTTAKQNLEMNAAYPARKPQYEAELQEARDIYSECQAARRAALAAAKEANRG